MVTTPPPPEAPMRTEPVVPDSCPITWQPNALFPVFYGMREHGPADGLPMRSRMYFPSLDGAVRSAPLLRSCGRYPLLVFVHGQCPDDADHFRRWHRLPAQLARAGYVVLVPDLTAIDQFPEPGHPDQQRLADLVDWARTRWDGRDVLLPAPATGVAGHSWGAVHAAMLGAAIDAGAVGSLSGGWSDTGVFDLLLTDVRPRLFTWGTDSRDTGPLSDQNWDRIPAPKHRARFAGGEHWDYLYNVQFPCDGQQGPCRHVGKAADDLLTMLFARYLPPELCPWLPDRIPPDLRPPPVERTREQEFYAGSYLDGLASFDETAACRVELDVELPLDHVVPVVLDALRPSAARRVERAGLVPVFTGSDDSRAHVYRQSPRAGTRVAARSEVRMAMRRGPAQ